MAGERGSEKVQRHSRHSPNHLPVDRPGALCVWRRTDGPTASAVVAPSGELVRFSLAAKRIFHIGRCYQGKHGPIVNWIE